MNRIRFYVESLSGVRVASCDTFETAKRTADRYSVRSKGGTYYVARVEYLYTTEGADQ